MSVKTPIVRRKFANEWDEIGYLYQKLLYWFYQREAPARARPFADRLEQLLRRAAPGDTAIFAEECRSLIHEVNGDFARAIGHREREIELIRRLHAIARKSTNGAAMLKGYGVDDLSDRLDLLATLCHDDGQLDKAIAVLEESRKLCETHAIAFDGADLLDDYRRERDDLRRKPERRGA